MAILDVVKLANYSLIAQAAYAFTTSKDDLVASLKDKASFTQTQADDFAARYAFIDSQPNDSTGFSATLYKDSASGKYIFAMRGTELSLTDPGQIASDLLATDLDQIGLLGYAAKQAASMYRYWKRLTTPAGFNVDYTDAELRKLYQIQNSFAAAPGFESFAGHTGSESICLLS
jgi:hypothetical protein